MISRLPSADPPLDPSGDEGRSLLRRELLDPAYHDQNLLQRLVGWLQRQVGSGLDATAQAPPLATFATILVALLLVLALVLLLSRLRRTASTTTRTGAVLTDEVVSADELRARAEAAYAQGRFADAVVDAFRAVAVRQVERGRLDDAPGATAHEVAAVLAVGFPERRAALDGCAALFDAVLYGDRPADAEQAVAVLGLDDSLAARR